MNPIFIRFSILIAYYICAAHQSCTKCFAFALFFLFRREIINAEKLVKTGRLHLARRWHGDTRVAASIENSMTGKKKTACIRTRVAPNHASYVRHASKILGWIKNACFRLVCGPSRTPLIYTCLPVACKDTHTRTHVCARVNMVRMASTRICI